jgi:bifunctional non-homologous end joining protein LigD
VLDGELIAGAGRLSDFYRLGGMPRAGAEAVVFVAFDLLWLDGEQLTNRPHRDRRARLEHLELDPVQVVPSYDAVIADDLLATCGEQGVAGVVQKRAAAPSTGLVDAQGTGGR